MEKIYAIRVLWSVGFLLFLSVGLHMICFYRFGWKSSSPFRKLSQKILLSLYMSGFLFFGFEYFFAQHYIRTDTCNFTYASQLWFREHWHPINQYKYRDAKTKTFDGKKVVHIVGDSFVAGYGVENVADRFADRVGAALGEDWEFVVIGRNGWNTEQEVYGMGAYPHSPDLIIFSHYVNDIADAAEFNGVKRPDTLKKTSPPIDFCARNSFFFNWLYWRAASFGVGTKYWDYLLNCYTDPKIWGRHVQELGWVISAAKQQQADLCVVVWPNLHRIKDSSPMTDPVVNYFREVGGAAVVDVGAAVEGRPARELVVNSLDNHPNSQTHQRVAELIMEAIADLPIVAESR